MSNYRTIQKLADTTGTPESSIRKMLKEKILTKCKIPGFNRIFIDIQEFDSKIQKDKDIKADESINLDNFLIS